MKQEYLDRLRKAILESCLEEKQNEIEELVLRRFQLGEEAQMTEEEIIDMLPKPEELVASFKEEEKPKSKNMHSTDLILDLQLFWDFELVRMEENGIRFLSEDDCTALRIDIDEDKVLIEPNDRSKKKRLDGKLYIGPEVVFNEVKMNCYACDVVCCSFEAKRLDVNAASADLLFDTVQADEFLLKTASGDTKMKRLVCRKWCYRSVSGDLSIDEIDSEEAEVSLVSGDVRIKTTTPAFYTIQTVSGDVFIYNGIDLNKVKATSVSGDIKIGGKKMGNIQTLAAAQLEKLKSKLKF